MRSSQPVHIGKLARCIVAIMAAAIANGVVAQTLEKSYILAEPLQYSKQGKFRGCGLNLKLLQESQAQTRDYVTLSINFWLDSPGVALVKTTLNKARAGTSPSLQQQRLKSTWARLKQESPLEPIKTMSGEDEAILSVVELKSALDFVNKAANKTELQVGFLQVGSKLERVFYGKPEITTESQQLLHECFDELIQNLNSSGEQ
ncbi:MAG: hypothetical protein WA056_10885 [Gallionella sp.]